MLTSGRYRVRQDNGEGNSLGRLIFRFPNNFSIYLHDTNNKQAFKRTNRAISHGCIRIEKPLELAVFLLDTPEEKTVNRLREAIGLPPLNSSIPIEKKEGEPLKVGIQRFDPSIPVVIDYYTLYPKPDGGWEESPDPYGYDEILLKKVRSFLNHLPFRVSYLNNDLYEHEFYGGNFTHPPAEPTGTSTPSI